MSRLLLFQSIYVIIDKVFVFFEVLTENNEI